VAELRESPVERRITVVIADDDGPFLESLKRIVDDPPHVSVVGSAGNGLEAIELVDELDTHVVVIDLHKPQLDGVSAVACMRHEHPLLCLIAITADDAKELHRAVQEAGADAVVLKDDLPARLNDEIAVARERLAV
jgi:two-component system nitrate/nitrite response regulator NarL